LYSKHTFISIERKKQKLKMSYLDGKTPVGFKYDPIKVNLPSHPYYDLLLFFPSETLKGAYTFQGKL